jgi:hypothetical protein
MSDNVIYGIDFKGKSKPLPIVEITEEELQTLTEMANDIVLQITDPWESLHDGKEPA